MLLFYQLALVLETSFTVLGREKDYRKAALRWGYSLVALCALCLLVFGCWKAKDPRAGMQASLYCYGRKEIVSHQDCVALFLCCGENTLADLILKEHVADLDQGRQFFACQEVDRTNPPTVRIGCLPQ